jgi:hypothetical protein
VTLADAVIPGQALIIMGGMAHAIEVAPDGTLKVGVEIGPQDELAPMAPLPEVSNGEAQVPEANQPAAA